MPPAPMPPSEEPTCTRTAVATHLTTVDVKDLHPYMLARNKQLLVRLMAADQRTYDNERGSGTISTLVVADSTGDVQITFFSQPALFDRLRVGVVYYVPLAKSQIKPATRFNKARLPYEVSLGRDAAIRDAAAASAVRLPSHNYDFVGVATLADRDAGARVDVRGVVASLSGTLEYARKSDGRRGLKRLLELCDDSCEGGAPCSVHVTLFVKDGESLDISVGTIVALRGTVECWNGATSLTVWPDGVACNPRIVEVAHLAEWWRTLVVPPERLALRWSFVRLDALPDKPVGARVDVCGVVLDVEVCASVHDAVRTAVPDRGGRCRAWCHSRRSPTRASPTGARARARSSS